MSSPVAFVAGASGVLGRSICSELARAGFSVAVHARSNVQRALDVVAQLAAIAPQAEHRAVVGELVEECRPVSEVLAATGRLDVLVNAAHPPHRGGAHVSELDPGELDRQLHAVTIHAALCRAAVPAMRERGYGRIVYVAGALMQRPAAGFGAYGAAKAAATTLTRYLAVEEGRSGITANIVAPGRVVDPDTPDDELLSDDQRVLAEQLQARLALGEFPTPRDVARVIRTLVEPAGAALTGQTLWVTGGEPLA